MIKVSFGSDQSANNPAMATMPLFVRHDFLINDDGELEHHMDGRLRATVPPEGWEAYAESWPDCHEVVKAARKPTVLVKPAGRPAPKKKK